MIKPLIKLIATTLLFASATQAALAVNPTVTGSMGNFQLQTIDLTPTDGIAAGYRIDSQNLDFYNAISTGRWWEPSESIREPHVLQLGEAFDSSLALHQYTASTSTNGSLGNFSTTLEWDASNTDFHGVNMGNQYLYTAKLTLAPGTALVLSGDVLQQFTPGGMHQDDLVQSFFDAKFAYNVGNNYFSSSYYSHLIHSPNDIAGGWDKSDHFGIVVTTDTASDRIVDLTIGLYGAIEAVQPLSPTLNPVAAVPEPGTFGMLAAGMAVIFGAARRRKRCS